MSLLIVNGRVLDPANGIDAVQDVLVTNGLAVRMAVLYLCGGISTQ